ncbi:MAG: endolytic transglycosylase MltG [Patescibacteria group bacterium]|jgi:UPF0755 protein
MKNKILTVIVILAVLWSAYFLGDVFWQDRGAGEVDQSFVIKPGEGVGEISANLSAVGLINSQFNFKVYLFLLRRSGKIQAGDYQLRPSLSLRELANIITYGWSSNEKRLTLVEGLTNQQFGEYLVDNLFSYDGASGSRAGYLKDWQTALTKKYQFDFLDVLPAGVDLEGYLFPDTYNFYNNSDPEAVINKMLANFGNKVTPDLWAKIKASGHTLHEVLTMASILEREVNDTADRRIVADIFWRRLKIGMALQADSTVNYLTGKKTPSISAKDKKIDSPYNTYKYRGLPPGPINNPGLDAIIAATEPTANDYWYFLTTPEGEVIYSQTLEEHNRAKAKYLK